MGGGRDDFITFITFITTQVLKGNRVGVQVNELEGI